MYSGDKEKDISFLRSYKHYKNTVFVLPQVINRNPSWMISCSCHKPDKLNGNNKSYLYHKKNKNTNGGSTFTAGLFDTTVISTVPIFCFNCLKDLYQCEAL